ncbi:hypothetical protein E4U21_003501 [Claviceps maximensis]|nr:hypothetical protein E4U21_003501 [Claviceps maximensis]
MVSPAEQTIERLQTRLEPFVKPREQINYIRRVLALELGSYTGEGPIQQPLSLNQGPILRTLGPELKGLHREYIEALRANISARQSFEDIAYGQEISSCPDPKPERNSSVLEDHLTLSRLRKKRDSLVTVQSYLERLADLPTPPQEPRDVEQMLNDGNPQPAVPAEVLNSFVVEQASTGVDIQDQISQLEKTVFRAKLLLKREENLLADARARCKIKPELVSNGAKMEALNGTRNELINWIETELSKASAEEKVVVEGTRQQKQTSGPAVATPDQAGISNQLRQVQDKYKTYVAARRKLLALTSCAPWPSMGPPDEGVNEKSLGRAETHESATNIDYLLIPHIETIISQSRRQKGLITHKSHFSATLDNQRSDSCQLISRLAEESQLLAAFPMKDSARRQSGVPDIITDKHADRPDLASRIKPWLFAADAAKIGTLEAVAENVEVGQVALENSMETLHQMKTLLGVQDEVEQDDCTAPNTMEGDMWLDNELGNGAKKSHKKALKAKSTVSQNKIDPWVRLYGNLGLIGHDDVP